MGSRDMSILLVDDEPAIRAALRRTVSRLGYRTLEAESAREALSLIDSGEAPVAAICDYNMPRQTGLELAHMLRARMPDLPILLLSGRAPTTDVEKALSSGLLWAFVAKPWDLSWMRSAIPAMIERQPPPCMESPD